MDTLTQDARLNRLVTFEKIGTPLGELLRSLNNKELTLSVNRTCDGQKLQVRLKQRSLRTLMQALAELMPGEWTAKEDGSGYLFRMTNQAVTRRQRWWELFLSEREKALAAQRAWVLQNLRGERPAVQEFDISPEQHAQRQAGQEFFKLLSPDLQERLANQMDETTFYRNSFGTSNTESALVLPMSDLPPAAREAARKYLLKMPNLPADFNPDAAMARLTNGGINVMAGFTLPDGRDTGTAFDGNLPGVSAAMPLLTPDQSRLPGIVQRLGKEAPEGWKQLAAYQQSKVWRNTPPDKVTLRERQRRRTETLQWLGNTANVEYVADYYSRSGSGMTSAEKADTPKRTPQAEFDALAAALDVSWKQVDSVYLVRDNRWYRNDWLEVPASTLRRWQPFLALRPEKHAPSDATRALTQQRLRKLCDWQADVVNALSPWQIGWGLKYAQIELSGETTEAFVKRQPKKQRLTHEDGTATEYTLPWEDYPFWEPVEALLNHYKLAQFYAALDTGARTALLQDGLDFASLPADAQAQALYLIPNLRIWGSQHPGRPVRLRLRQSLPPGIVPVGAIMGALEFTPL